MRRQRWFEIHDQAWFPGFLRDRVTEALETMWNTSRTYHPVAEKLREAVRRSGAERVIDLCSGGGGPWPGLYGEIAGEDGWPVWLTDRYPNERTVQQVAEGIDGLTARSEPVDARHVPVRMRGFRTIFSSFHHFDPEQGRDILADAFARREGIAVVEAAQRSWKTMLCVTAVPLLAIRNACGARPVRGSRILWTCMIPLVPAILWIDGMLSCLRSYSRQDLAELVEGLRSPDYEWEWGEERGGRVAITYLIGTPLRPQSPVRAGAGGCAGRVAVPQQR